MIFQDILSSFTGQVDISFKIKNGLNIPGSTTPMSFRADIANDLTFLLGDGTGTTAAQQANVNFFDQRILAPGASEQLDLTLLPDTQLYSGAANYFQQSGFSLIKCLAVAIVANTNGTIASSAMIGGAASNPWQGWLSAGATEDIDSDGIPYGKCSDTGRVVNGTNRYLKITNLDMTNQLTYQILAFGLHS